MRVRFIDFIRVLGLILVLSYHLFEDFLPGGFLGVDIFFVISGYLITTITISKFEQKKEFNFISYIKRRLNRIFPALFFAIVFTFPFVKLIPSDFTANISKQIAAALGFVTNYFEIANGGSYEARLLPHLYIHTWSLSLEIGYYLFWGVGCALIMRKNVATNTAKIVLGCVATIMSVLSYLNMQYLFTNNLNKSIAYLSTTSHIFPFFIGSMFGILFGFKLSEKTSAKLKEKAKLFGSFLGGILLLIVSAIIYLCFNVKFGSVFVCKHGFLIIAILTSLAMVITRMLHEVVSPQYKDLTIVSHLANISYPMYLFHWPFYIIFSNSIDSKIIAVITTLVVSYAFSLVVYYFIEPNFYSASFSEKENECAYKKVVNVLLCVAIVGCLALDVNILANQKTISSLEEEQMVGNVVQNFDRIEDLKKGIENINQEPFLEKDGIYNFDELDINSETEQKVSLTPIPKTSNTDTTKKGELDVSPSNTPEPVPDIEPSNIPEPIPDIEPSNVPEPVQSVEPGNTPGPVLNVEHGDTPKPIPGTESSEIPQIKEPLVDQNKEENQELSNKDPENTKDPVVEHNKETENDSQATPVANQDSGSETLVVENGSQEPKEEPKTVTLIGDSVALGARKNIVDTVPNTYADTRGNRTLRQGYSIIMDLQRKEEVGDYLIVALGTNGCSEWKKYINKIIEDLEPGHRLLFVTPYDGRWNDTWYSYQTTQYLRSIKDKYPFVTVIDWAAEVFKDTSLVGADKIHIGGYTKGIKAFTKKVIEGIEEASKKPAKS